MQSGKKSTVIKWDKMACLTGDFIDKPNRLTARE